MKLFLLIYCVLSFNATRAQSYKSTFFSTKEGLSNNNVTCLAKDKNGFLWVGTSNGLNRFDGSAFDRFHNNPTDPSSLQNNEIQDILITKNNQLWVSTIDGISHYNRVTQRFDNYAPDTSVLPKMGYGFAKLFETIEGNICVGTWYDLLIFDVTTRRFTSTGWGKFATSLSIPNANNTRVLVQSIVPKSASELWLLSTYGLFSWNVTTRQFRFHENNYISDYYGCSIGYVDGKSNVYLNSYNKGIIQYRAGDNSWRHHNVPVAVQDKNAILNQVAGIQYLGADTILYCNGDQILLFNAVKGETMNKVFFKNELLKNAAPVVFNGILKDNEVLWVQSNSGLIKLSLTDHKFVETTLNNRQSLGRCFFAGKPNELILNDVGRDIFVYNTASRQQVSITTKDHLPFREELFGFLRTAKDSAYFSTESGFYLCIGNKASAIGLPEKKIDKNPYTIRNFVQDGRNNLYLRCRKQGIIRYDCKTQFSSFLNIVAPNENDEYAALFFDDATNLLWVAIQNKGVYLYDINTQKTKHHLLNTAASQRGGSISCIAKAANGDILLTDMYNGLFIYSNKSKSFVRLSNHDGLPGNNCFWLTTVKDKVWIGNALGLSLMDSKTRVFKSYATPGANNYFADYFISDTIGNSFNSYGDKLVSWKISSFTAPPVSGKIYLRQVQLFNKNLPIQDNFSFRHFENSIHFTVGYLLLSNEEELVFEYNLNEGGWVSIGSDDKISFSNLSANHYNLQVRLKTDAENILKINFLIRPPFYKTWWFLSAVLIFVALLSYWLFKRRINTVRKQAALKQQIAETEMMALRAQMNPHFIFNCISSIDNFILDNDAANASAYLNKFAKLIRNILDNSVNDVVPFWKDWETLSYYIDLEKLRSNGQFVSLMQADETLLNGHYKIPPLIIQPYVENAILHGLRPLQNRKGLLEISASLRGELLVYSIKDNGVGRNVKNENSISQSPHNSYGMALTAQRIELFNAQFKNAVVIIDLKDEAGNNAGTLVTITLNV